MALAIQCINCTVQSCVGLGYNCFCCSVYAKLCVAQSKLAYPENQISTPLCKIVPFDTAGKGASAGGS